MSVLFDHRPQRFRHGIDWQGFQHDGNYQISPLSKPSIRAICNSKLAPFAGEEALAEHKDEFSDCSQLPELVVLYCVSGMKFVMET